MDVKRKARLLREWLRELERGERAAGRYVEDFDLDGPAGAPPVGVTNALGEYMRQQPQVIFGDIVTVGAAAPPAGAGAFYPAQRLLRVELPPEVAGVWTLTVYCPGFIGYTIFGAGTLIDGGAPNVLDSFLRIRWGSGDGLAELEADLQLGQQINLAGRYFEVDLVARDPLGAAATRLPYRLGCSLSPGAGSSRGLVRRTVNVGNLLFATTSLHFSVPRFAVEWMSHWGGVANGAAGANISRDIRFFSDYGATEIARYDMTAVSVRTMADASQWLPVPARAQTFNWTNNGAAGTQSNASLTFRLGM